MKKEKLEETVKPVVEIPEVLPPEKPAAAVVKKGAGRPGNVLKLVGDKPIEERIATIAEYHRAVKLCYAQSAFYALMVGFELHAARAQIGHGNWEQWVKANMEFHPATAWRYMQAAERKHKQIPNLARVQDFALGVSPMDLDAEQQALLMEAIRNATDGETTRQLYLELGLVKPEPKPKGGARPPSKLTDEERKALHADAARADWQDIERSLSEFVTKHKYELLEDHEILIARDVLNGALTLLPEPKPVAEKLFGEGGPGL